MIASFWWIVTEWLVNVLYINILVLLFLVTFYLALYQYNTYCVFHLFQKGFDWSKHQYQLVYSSYFTIKIYNSIINTELVDNS